MLYVPQRDIVITKSSFGYVDIRTIKKLRNRVNAAIFIVVCLEVNAVRCTTIRTTAALVITSIVKSHRNVTGKSP